MCGHVHDFSLNTVDDSATMSMSSRYIAAILNTESMLYEEHAYFFSSRHAKWLQITERPRVEAYNF